MPATYDKIATTTLGSAQSSVTFSSISGSYTDLVLICNGSSSTNDTASMRFNGDTGTNYSNTYINGSGSAASSGRQTSLPAMLIGEMYTDNSTVIIQINNYSNSTTYKTGLIRANTPQSGGYVQVLVGLWRNTAAITSISLQRAGGNFSSGSIFTLYGIKAA